MIARRVGQARFAAFHCIFRPSPSHDMRTVQDRSLSAMTFCTRHRVSYHWNRLPSIAILIHALRISAGRVVVAPDALVGLPTCFSEAAQRASEPTPRAPPERRIVFTGRSSRQPDAAPEQGHARPGEQCRRLMQWRMTRLPAWCAPFWRSHPHIEGRATCRQRGGESHVGHPIDERQSNHFGRNCSV